MALTRQALVTLAVGDNDFSKRVTFTARKLALVIMAEDPLTQSHVYRVAFAYKILDDKITTRQLALCLITHPGVSTKSDPGLADVTDTELDTAMDQLFDRLAGVAT